MNSDPELLQVLKKSQKGDSLSEIERLILTCHRWTETRSRAEILNQANSEPIATWEPPICEPTTHWLWVCLPNNPGDLVMALWVVHALKIKYPKSKLLFWADSETRSLVERHPEIDRVGILPRKLVSSLRGKQPLAEIAKALYLQLQDLLETRPSVIINLSQDLSVALWLSLFECPQRLGPQVDVSGTMILKDFWSQWLFAIPSERKQNPYHAVDVYLRIAEVAQNSYPQAHWVLSELSFPVDSKPIALQIGSAWPGKEWPLKEWKDLVLKILSHTSHHIILVGSTNEWDRCVQIQSLCPERISNFAGQTQLAQLGPLLKSSSLLITGDTFAQHVAAVVQTPILALYGCSSPIETGPYGIGHRVLVQEKHTETESFNFADSKVLHELKADSVWATLVGKIPESPWELWESYWDEDHSCLAWFQKSPQKQAQRIRQESLFSIDSKWALSRKAYEAWALLGTCLNQIKGSPKDILVWKELEALEEDFESLTPNSMGAEIYRLQRNALNWRDPFHWLNQRHTLWNHWNKKWEISDV
jgi:ADP-heptose:LPS heptosyltransferase